MCRKMRLSSFFAYAKDGETIILDTFSPYSDRFVFDFKENVKRIVLKDSEGSILVQECNSFCVDLNKNQAITVCITPCKEGTLLFEVKAENNISVLPYDPLEYGELPLADGGITDEVKISYVKRQDGLYVNDNNPEAISDFDLNKALTRQDVSNNQVFATFEHNNQINGDFYYGYMVRNTDDKDIFITVKNIGFQIGGAGTWLGEKEWVEFYNTEFRIKGREAYTPAQQATYNAFYGFCNSYKSENHQPITYRIPKGEHIYVMGGTTEDSFCNINVFGSADMPVNKARTGCSNGVVLFDVFGKAEGAMFVYNDVNKIKDDHTSNQGYVVYHNNDESKSFGSQYIGYDTCNGVVDNHAVWHFDDDTVGFMPVTFDSYYCEDVPRKGNPYERINSTKHTYHGNSWVTHINPQGEKKAVGTDMTRYITVNKDGENIAIDSDSYDGLGNLANIGNWMADYIDTFTLVNHGEKERLVTVRMRHNGALAVMVRDENGKVLPETVRYAIRMSKNEYGDGIEDNFSYQTKIPSHTAVRFHTEYNLLANSCGHIVHQVELI